MLSVRAIHWLQEGEEEGGGVLGIPWQLLDTERHSVPRSLFTQTLVAHTVSETPITSFFHFFCVIFDCFVFR